MARRYECECETPTTRALAQIVVSYHQTILDIAHLEARQSEYRVGEQPTADFILEHLVGSTVLVRKHREQLEITIPPGFCCHDHPHLRAGDVIDLTADEHQRITLKRGALRIDIAQVRAEPSAISRRRLDRPFVASLLGHLVIAFLLLGFIRATPEDPVAQQAQLDLAAARLGDYNDRGSGGSTTLPGPTTQDEPERDTIAGVASARGKHEVGTRGSARAARESHPHGTGADPRGGEGLDRNSSPSAAAREVGLLGVLAASQDYQAFVGTGAAFGDGPADSAMWASTAGLAHMGSGGLNLVGEGRGGGGMANGVAGFAHSGVLATKGGSGSLTSSGSPGFGGRARRVPRTILCMLMVPPGGIDRDVIRRVIRAHENEIRGCYNQALVNQPMLAGRITVDFTIGGSGKVGSAIISADETHDEQLGTCVQRAVKHWKFPGTPNGGVSLVSYTFALRVD
jgi:hypothetical protein